VIRRHVVGSARRALYPRRLGAASTPSKEALQLLSRNCAALSLTGNLEGVSAAREGGCHGDEAHRDLGGHKHRS
jgi:hypothetical protein